MIGRARRRGALPKRVDIELLLDILTGTIYGRLRERPGPLDPQWVRRVVRWCYRVRPLVVALETLGSHDETRQPPSYRRAGRGDVGLPQ